MRHIHSDFEPIQLLRFDTRAGGFLASSAIGAAFPVKTLPCTGMFTAVDDAVNLFAAASALNLRISTSFPSLSFDFVGVFHQDVRHRLLWGPNNLPVVPSQRQQKFSERRFPQPFVPPFQSALHWFPSLQYYKTNHPPDGLYSPQLFKFLAVSHPHLEKLQRYCRHWCNSRGWASITTIRTLFIERSSFLSLGFFITYGGTKSTLQSVSMMQAASCDLTSLRSKW